MADPARGEVWVVDLNPTRGHEQSGVRPALVVSVDEFNAGPAARVVVLPLTTRDRRVPSHVRIEPPEGGVQQTSFIKCKDLRSLSRQRLANAWGRVTRKTMEAVEDRLRILLDL